MSEQKTVLITGASRGIGAATARLFARHGYSVCINYRSDDLAAEAVRRDVIACGVGCITVKADVSNASDVQGLFRAVDDGLGRLTVLVNNAGILKKQCKMVDISEARFVEIMKTNVLSCFLCCREAVQRMAISRAGAGGAIVNVSSMASKSGSPNEYVDYAASKGAMDTLTRGLALEVAGEGIRVNAVRPGLIHTDMHAAGGEPDRVNRLTPKIPMQRGGSANEVAEAILWLASEKSSFVTGSFIDLAGGL